METTKTTTTAADEQTMWAMEHILKHLQDGHEQTLLPYVIAGMLDAAILNPLNPTDTENIIAVTRGIALGLQHMTKMNTLSLRLRRA